MTLAGAAEVFFEASPDALLVVDQGGVIVAANARAHALLGHDAGALLGTPLDALVPARYADAHPARRASFFAGAPGHMRRAPLPVSAIRRDGVELVVEVNLSLARFEDAPYTVVSLRDVSERERELARLAALSNELEVVLESLPEPVVIRDREVTLYVNSALVRKLGYENAQELIDRPLLASVHPDDRALAAERMAAVEIGVATGTVEFRYVTRDGEVLPLENGLPRRVIYRGRPAWLLVLHDTREQKRTMLARAAQERMVTVGTLAAGVGHEINNPLTYVIGNLDLLAEEVQTLSHSLPQQRRAELLDLLAEARDGAERIRKIVRVLRTFARGDREERVRIDVHGAVEMALQLAQSALRHVTPVACDLRPTPPVLADESQLVQVLVNLLVNAAHALAPTPIDRNLVHVRTWTEGGRAVLEVSDNGPGMTREVARRVFEPFFTTKGVRDGMGLGLSIVHNIVTGLGGAVTCESSPGSGATFRVTLPGAP